MQGWPSGMTHKNELVPFPNGREWPRSKTSVWFPMQAATCRLHACVTLLKLETRETVFVLDSYRVFIRVKNEHCVVFGVLSASGRGGPVKARFCSVVEPGHRVVASRQYFQQQAGSSQRQDGWFSHHVRLILAPVAISCLLEPSEEGDKRTSNRY